jgi:hypothetical protein
MPVVGLVLLSAVLLTAACADGLAPADAVRFDLLVTPDTAGAGDTVAVTFSVPAVAGGSASVRVRLRAACGRLAEVYSGTQLVATAPEAPTCGDSAIDREVGTSLRLVEWPVPAVRGVG